jgi:hypothetical protein
MYFSRLIPSLLVAAMTIGFTTAPASAQRIRVDANADVVIESVDFVGLSYDAVNGVLTATGGTVSGTIAGLPFTTNIENFALQLVPGTGNDVCTVLDLELGPIDIDLLGLHVDTSPICLTITAFEGEGILGDLLCAIAGGDLDLLRFLPRALTVALTAAQEEGTVGAAQDGSEICDGECEILDLAIGPVDLDLLGVNIHLDDCDDGPVLICVSASEGQGLLGELLCALTGTGATFSSLDDVEGLVGAIFDAFGRRPIALTAAQFDALVGEVTRLLRDGNLSRREASRLDNFIERLLRRR